MFVDVDDLVVACQAKPALSIINLNFIQSPALKKETTNVFFEETQFYFLGFQKDVSLFHWLSYINTTVRVDIPFRDALSRSRMRLNLPFPIHKKVKT